MAKLYINQSPNEKVENLKPKEETISFLLNYSKALHVLDGKQMQYENLLN
ncbi:hypothetical protein [Mesonia aestuariivivens]|uniref:Uncharacterized protein n=1 Tax=Mesonia aestuariivivens TaxID=2796128 RepID=A0ABS6VYK1_9FLAO|nr:hypothetical protein [Mesonia aestuariivivens]MBW2960676.1 hypothetical protein [Mesonia aestuariivivens]